MSNPETTPLPTAPLMAVHWAALCPGCHLPAGLECYEVSENEAGAYEVNEEARFPVCEYCGLQFEVNPVQIVEVTP